MAPPPSILGIFFYGTPYPVGEASPNAPRELRLDTHMNGSDCIIRQFTPVERREEIVMLLLGSAYSIAIWSTCCVYFAAAVIRMTGVM